MDCEHEWHEEEMRGFNCSKFFCVKCNLEKTNKKELFIKLPDWGDDSLSFAYWDRMHKEKGCQDDN